MANKIIDPYRPQGWSDFDMSQASLEMEQFTKTSAYAWLDNYVSQRIRQEQRELVPSRPEDVTHGKFIAASARCRALEAFHDGATHLINWKENSDVRQDQNSQG